jgi:glycosyltransferase involved in cell wall biosynthesis
VIPGVEDYGLVPIEANACGVPAVAFAQGGVLDSQIHGLTAVFVREQKPSAFAEAFAIATNRPWNKTEIHQHAVGFSAGVFRERFYALVKAMEFDLESDGQLPCTGL